MKTVTDALLKMELKCHSSVILSKFDGKSSKVNQVIFIKVGGIIKTVFSIRQWLNIIETKMHASSPKDK